MCEEVMSERLLMPKTVSYNSYVFSLLMVVCRKNGLTFRNLSVVNGILCMI
jgi:hypothetical protein